MFNIGNITNLQGKEREEYNKKIIKESLAVKPVFETILNEEKEKREKEEENHGRKRLFNVSNSSIR